MSEKTASSLQGLAPAYEGGGLSQAVSRDREPSRLASLDGLRAVAILVVLMHNVGSPEGQLGGVLLRVWVVISNAGWAGVQLFFVLSGFLITRILLNSKGGAGWIRAFYARRVLRIFPLYYLLLVISFGIAPHVAMLSPLVREGHRSQLWFWTYLSNWVSPFGGMPGNLPHVWSLAVEEQFYLIWPFLVAVTTERSLARTCGAMIIGALFVRIALHSIYPATTASAAAYELTIARCDAIALGALVAVAVRNERATAFLSRYLIAGLLTAFGLVLAVTSLQHGLPSTGIVTETLGQPVTGLLSAFLILLCVLPPRSTAVRSRLQTIIVGALSTSWLRTIGKYSYAIYVFHRPVHVLIRPMFAASLESGGPDRRLFVTVVYTATVLGASMLLARLSWTAIEQPFLSLKRHFPMPVGRERQPQSAVDSVRG